MSWGYQGHAVVSGRFLNGLVGLGHVSAKDSVFNRFTGHLARRLVHHARRLGFFVYFWVSRSGWWTPATPRQPLVLPSFGGPSW